MQEHELEWTKQHVLWFSYLKLNSTQLNWTELSSAQLSESSESNELSSIHQSESRKWKHMATGWIDRDKIEKILQTVKC